MEPVYKNLGKVRPTIDNNDWSIDNKYDLLTILYDPSSNKSYISRKDVPAGVVIDNREYWLPFGVGRFVDNAIININYLDGVSQELVTYTLEEAIARIGNEDKRLGVIISFYGNEASDSHTPGWCLYQFMSDDLNDWDDVNAWNSIYYNRNKNVGWFRTESELLAIYPSPHKGDYCYIGTSLISSLVYRCYENGTWVNTHELASANIGITIGGNIRISENGTWVVDDEDTGIKAVGTGVEKMTYTPSQEDGCTNILQIKLTDGTQFSFPIKNGNQGNSGIVVPDLETFLAELVNNLTTDDGTKALSAAQGVVLDNKISQLGQSFNESLGDLYKNTLIDDLLTDPSDYKSVDLTVGEYYIYEIGVSEDIDNFAIKMHNSASSADVSYTIYEGNIKNGTIRIIAKHISGIYIRVTENGVASMDNVSVLNIYNNTNVLLQKNKEDINSITTQIEGTPSITTLSYINGYYINLNAEPSLIFNPIPDALCQYMIIDCYKGDVLKVTARATGVSRPWALVGNDGVLISKSSATNVVDGIVKVEQNCKFVSTNETNLQAHPNIVLTRCEGGIVNEVGKESLMVLGELNSLFKYPYPMDVHGGLLGSNDATHILYAPLNKDSFNIRFKFRMDVDCYNHDVYDTSANKVVFRMSDGIHSYNAVTIRPRKLTQIISTFIDEGGSEANCYIPCFNNGVKFLSNYPFLTEGEPRKQNMGEWAFSIRYTGPATDVVTCENTTTDFRVTINGTTITRLHANYDTLSGLYSALNDIDGIEVDYMQIEGHTPQDIAVFEETHLTTKCYGIIDGDPQGTPEYYYDAGKLYIPFAHNNEWHQVEIVAINGTCYISVDGFLEGDLLTNIPISDTFTQLIFFGGLSDFTTKVSYKDIEICTNSARDAEIKTATWDYINDTEKTDTRLISSVNPYIVMFCSHRMTLNPTSQATQEEINDLQSNIDRIGIMCQKMKSLGYVYMPAEEIIEYVKGNRELPKRVCNFNFDDVPVQNFLWFKNRSVFNRYGIKPTMCIVSDVLASAQLEYEGVSISAEKALSIGEKANFEFVSHTRNHRSRDRCKFSQLENELKQDIKSGDLVGINPNIIAFAYDDKSPYLMNTVNYLGFMGGLGQRASVGVRRCTNAAMLPRSEPQSLNCPLRVALRMIV